MKKILSFVAIGLFAGAASWAVAGLISDRFEPFDSGSGFLANQIILAFPALVIGYSQKPVYLLLYFIAAWMGLNGYAFMAGGSEQRAWAYLGLVTTLVLLVYPFFAGLAGILFKKLRFGK